MVSVFPGLAVGDSTDSSSDLLSGVPSTTVPGGCLGVVPQCVHRRDDKSEKDRDDVTDCTPAWNQKEVLAGRGVSQERTGECLSEWAWPTRVSGCPSGELVLWVPGNGELFLVPVAGVAFL